MANLPIPAGNPVLDYLVDAWQRNILFLDTLRERSLAYREHMASPAPDVLHFRHEPVMHGLELSRPVNYDLLRILPGEVIPTDPCKRPIIVIDPRAGHGPGIGGFKPDSEIGVALASGHPCYFVSFTTEPVEGQTILDVIDALGSFQDEVIRRHPEAQGLPLAIGNCQAGWALAIAAAIRPDRYGPLLLPGAPLAYWQGTHGGSPMRYAGGMLGGSWLTALTGDLGAGRFDGAWLVANFEAMNPANTLWTKQYNVWANIDTEPERYLAFERWWGGHAILGAQEMQWITDELFVGNRLVSGELRANDGTRIDLRNVRGPIIVFCSKGDDITPPPQALGWILELYQDADDIRAHDQTIVYSVHDAVGHLGIFVSGSVARKEHQEFTSNIDLIDVLPPGLFEAVLTKAGPDTPNAQLVAGEWVLHFEPRDLDDIRALGCNDQADERRFATVARLSDINLGLYRTFMQPWVRALATPELALAARRLHPARLPYELFGHDGPAMRMLEEVAEEVRAQRRPVSDDNPFRLLQEQFSKAMVTMLDAWRDLRDGMTEQAFLAIYGQPMLQALVGLRARDEPLRPPPGEEPEHRAFVAAHAAEVRRGIGTGTPADALIRAVVWLIMPGGRVDERTFAAVRNLRAEHPECHAAGLDAFKARVRLQTAILREAGEEAISALPQLVPEDARGGFLPLVRHLAEAAGPLVPEAERRLERIAALLAAEPVPARPQAAAKPPSPPPARKRAALPRRRAATSRPPRSRKGST
ncbi:MAG TPA: DUF3141 domain-containing protein [Geminicoccus sp.]|uniref:DUF3141 domain-containing protein n=1 Tax=Geminicoccus sp. TaxID=2024832 RepID=UPI002C84EDBA|nr:DUF3141 domain-containing protein [Geminicoccus sp.]HWL71432.1 DUF3141 domain-containing protein [Geminicoccus sp.]